MSSFHRTLFSLFILLSAFAIELSAQEVLLGDENQNYPPRHVQPTKPGPTLRATPPPALSLPFFDDFSLEKSTPDTSKWNIGSSTVRIPRISLSKGINPPSKGVLTFDGATISGKKHKNNVFSGQADTLTSQAIDLAGLNSSNNVYLSFFLQPGGLGDAPESSDSFFVYFDSTGNHTFEKVFAISGDSISTNKFTLFFLPIDKAQWFHGNFHFKFASEGSLNGELDVWHLDYVSLAANRSVSDTTFPDVSLIRIENAIMDGYTEMPWYQFNFAGLLDPIKVLGNNLGSTATSNSLIVEIVNPEPFNGNNLSGTLQDVSVLNPGAYAFFNPTVSSISVQQNLTDSAAFIVKAKVSPHNDSLSTNDSVSKVFRLENRFAKDDGEADLAYGLTSPRGFCMRFTLPAKVQNRLKTIWINWAPTLFVNGTTAQSGTMEGKSFRLSVWNDDGGVPSDTVLLQKLGGMLINYGDSLNEFIPYNLTDSNGIEVSKTFYVGIAQNDEFPVGMGFDANLNNQGNIFYQNSNDDWIQTSFKGTLMIRPEFEFNPAVAIDGEMKTISGNTILYPNPVTTGKFQLSGIDFRQVSSLSYRIVNLNGQEIMSETNSRIDFPMTIELPEGIASGMYFLLLEGITTEGNQFSDKHKIVVNGLGH